jgi:hypothetical protein
MPMVVNDPNSLKMVGNSRKLVKGEKLVVNWLNVSRITEND